MADHDYAVNGEWKRCQCWWGNQHFECVQHARWSAFLNFFDVDYEYRPELIGITQDLVIRPTFKVCHRIWMHCVSGELSAPTWMAAQIVAERTGYPVAVASGPIFFDAEPQNTMPLRVTNGEGHSVTRYWGLDRYGKLALVSEPTARFVTPDVIRAYSAACNVTPESDPNVIRQEYRRSLALLRRGAAARTPDGKKPGKPPRCS